MNDLRGRIALVTGAGSGLGEATSYAFARAGVSLACVDINREAADRTVRRAEECGVRAIAYECDVSDASEVARVVASALEDLGGLDVLVNCAAIDFTYPVEELTVEQWDREIAVNLRGPFLMAKAALPALKQRGGHIVNISSTAGVRAWSDASAYHASKWGLIGFGRGLGVECRRHNVRVTTVIPGGMRTHFFDRFVEQGIPLPDERDLQEPTSVAEMIVCAVSMPADSVVQELVITSPSEPSWP